MIPYPVYQNLSFVIIGEINYFCKENKWITITKNDRKDHRMLWITRLSGRLSTLTMGLLVAPVYAVRRVLFWVARPRVSWMRVRDAAALYRSYRQLAKLDPRLRQDLGLDDDAVRALLLRPALTQLSPWAPEKLKQSVEESQAIGRAPKGRNLPNTPAANPSFYQTRGRADLASPGCHP